MAADLRPAGPPSTSPLSDPTGAPPPASPPTERVMEILNVLAGEPGRHLLLADITKATGLSQATCVRILDTLNRGGYVARRHADKRYGLGPALIGLGNAARTGFGPLELARPLMDETSAALGCGWVASAVLGDHIVVLDRSGSSGAVDWPVPPHPGTRYPFAPPSGVLYVAWDTDEVIDRWLTRPPLVATAPDHGLLRQVVASCHDRGYLVERLSEATAIAESLLADIVSHELPPSVRESLGRAAAVLGERDYVMSELNGRADLDVGSIVTPVFNEEGRPQLILSFAIYREGVPMKRVREYAARLVEIGGQVTVALGGHDPWAAGRGRER